MDGWKLLASHPGGVCIPRYVVLRMDGGAGVRGRRRTRRLLVVVRGTADVTDAAINIAMTPGSFTHQGKEHQCHKGIVEAAAFLERMVRPVIWRELDALRANGVDPGNEVEVVFTGHSLGGATAAIAALELQGEFGPRVPVRSVGFSTPASLSESLAFAPLTRRICTTVVLGDDIIPRYDSSLGSMLAYPRTRDALTTINQTTPTQVLDQEPAGPEAQGPERDGGRRGGAHRRHVRPLRPRPLLCALDRRV